MHLEFLCGQTTNEDGRTLSSNSKVHKPKNLIECLTNDAKHKGFQVLLSACTSDREAKGNCLEVASHCQMLRSSKGLVVESHSNSNAAPH
jgi:hypothetical protein